MDRVKCEVCPKWFNRERRTGKYCSDKCRQWAYQNRKRVHARAVGYALTPAQLDDVKTIQAVSYEASSVVLKVCSVAGKELAAEVLDGMWSLLVHVGFMDKVVERG